MVGWVELLAVGKWAPGGGGSNSLSVLLMLIPRGSISGVIPNGGSRSLSSVATTASVVSVGEVVEVLVVRGNSGGTGGSTTTGGTDGVSTAGGATTGGTPTRGTSGGTTTGGVPKGTGREDTATVSSLGDIDVDVAGGVGTQRSNSP